MYGAAGRRSTPAGVSQRKIFVLCAEKSGYMNNSFSKKST